MMFLDETHSQITPFWKGDKKHTHTHIHTTLICNLVENVVTFFLFYYDCNSHTNKSLMSAFLVVYMQFCILHATNNSYNFKLMNDGMILKLSLVSSDPKIGELRWWYFVTIPPIPKMSLISFVDDISSLSLVQTCRWKSLMDVLEMVPLRTV